MAKDKKRGFFSWLGFGRQQEPEAQPEEQATPTPVVEPEAERHESESSAQSALTPSETLPLDTAPTASMLA
ncbi:TPA: signal recognition particle-docking protein FtsY, partial [Edwardsiella tarda]